MLINKRDARPVSGQVRWRLLELVGVSLQRMHCLERPGLELDTDYRGDLGDVE